MKAPLKISIVHAIVGLLTFVIFLQTGWYMKTNDIGNLSDAHRMIYRAGHIYFLFSGLLNLSIGLQLQFSKVPWKKKVQYAGSILLLISPIIFLYGFYQEANIGQIDRAMTRIGIFLSLAGTGLHTLIFFIGLIKKTEN
ncbi:hypothetical protein [Reichenbachiella sp.]|uniref:hypothetical protein n=1 Tax=Reichenbachiella sp. TaxID=2184521 RepID=UPI003B5B4004